MDAVTVTTSLGNPHVAVAQAPGGLVARLSGSFDLYLDLGERAGGSIDVQLRGFSLVKSGNDTPVLKDGKSLSVVAVPPSPIHLNPGEKASVHLTIDDKTSSSNPGMEIAAEDRATICGSGQLRIVGVLHDSGSSGEDRSTGSMPFAPDGC
jgi:hypothetical protein